MSNDVTDLMPPEAVPLRPKHLLEVLKQVIPLREPTWIWGPPGVGKTGIVEQAAAALGILCPKTPPAACIQPVDVMGLPSVTGGRTVWNPPCFFPADHAWKGVIFLDELPQAPGLVQAALMQLTWGRSVGDYKLPEGASVVVCSNRIQDGSGVHRVLNALLNRFTHLDLVIHNDDWHEWAGDNNIDIRVRTYLRFKPSNLHNFNPKLNERAFCSPRAWERVHRHIKAVSPAFHQRVFSGIVGHAAATELVAHMRIYADLVTKEEIYASPSRARLHDDEPSKLWATCGMLIDDLKHHFTKAKAPAFVTYIDRMPEDFSIFAMKDAGKANRELYRHEAARSWMIAHEEAFADT